MKNLISKLLTALVVCSALFLVGCASSSQPANMIYQGSKNKYDENLTENIGLDSTVGGKATNPLWTSQISNEAFTIALESSLVKQDLYSSDGKYELDVKLINVDQPLFGLNFNVVTSIQYTLTDSETNKVIFKDLVVANYTATVGDAFAAIKRLRLANEGSARNNIGLLLDELSKLQIEDGKISIK